MISTRGVAVLAAAAALMMAGAACNGGDSSVSFEYTFDDGDDGWTHDFADLPVDVDVEFYELDGGQRALPGGLDGFGYHLKGSNHSDDLFMFIKTRATGMKASTTYEVAFEIEFATSIPEGLAGIGGSPGESFFVKVGAIAAESEPSVVSDDDHLRMNIDKGNQSTSGDDMIGIGHIGYDPAEGNEGEWRIKTLSNDDTFTVTTDDRGDVWFIVGTDSGFEGIGEVYLSALRFDLEVAG